MNKNILVNMQSYKTSLLLYQEMLKSRLLEKRMVTLQRHGLLATYAGSSGQEALYVAIGHLLDKEDVHVPYYRDQPCMLMRGYKPIDLIRYWSGSESGNTIPFNDLPICVPIATQCLHAAGVAYAQKIKQSNRITLVTLGDGATSKGDFYEAINFASLYELPIVFVINDNGWAISTPISKQTKQVDLTQKAQAVAMCHRSVDGTDIHACLDTLHEAIKLARSNQPVLVHAKTVRLCDHTTADDAKRYKSKAIITEEKRYDPIEQLKSFLIENYEWDELKDNALQTQIQEALDIDIDTFKTDHINEPQTMFEHCYEHMPQQLHQQQRRLDNDKSN